MTCEELRDQYELYALGVLEEPERSEIAAHLAREGDACIAGVRRARELMAALGASAPLVEPPAHLREKVLAQFGAPPKRAWSWTPVWIAVSAVLAVAAVWLGLDRREQAQIVAIARVEVQRKNAELARLNEALAMMNDPAVKEVVFGAGAPAPPKGRVFLAPRQGVLLIAYNLPPAPAGKLYEMWVIPKGGSPVPAGLFQSEADGTALYMRRGAVDVATTGAVAVTLEAEAGAAAPTTTPIIVAAL
jgi:anti-sigma-K factor RskA